jgi:hypothetical protein
VLGLSLYDLYLGTLSVFMVLGVVLIAVIIFPKHMSALVHKVADWAGRRSTRVRRAARGTAHRHRPGARVGPWHSTRRAAGWRCSGPRCSRPRRMRTSSSPATSPCARWASTPNFVDILLLQTLITFLLYFAPTPGASGIAEVLSALIMAAYVPKELTPLYILIWRLILSYFTIGFGFFVFTTWVRHGLKGISTEGDEGGGSSLSSGFRFPVPCSRSWYRG